MLAPITEWTKCGEMKPTERQHLRTHQVRHSFNSTRRVIHNMKDGFCKVAAARFKYGKEFTVKYRFISKLRFNRITAVDAA